jgi:hypothetical protein
MRLVSPRVSPRPRRIAAVAEGLAYVGGVLGVLGLVLFAVRSWADFSLFTRFALAGLSAAVLAFGGLVISDDRQTPSIRLRQFLWLGSTACVGVFGSVIGEEWFDTTDDARTVFVIAVAVAASSALFWWWRTGIVQHVTGLGALAVAFGAAAQELWDFGAAGTAVWLVGAAYLYIALMIEKEGNWITGTLGGIATIAGAIFASQEWTGPALLVAVASAASLIFLAAMFIGPHEAALRVGFTIVGITGMVQSTPPAIAHYADQAGVNTGLVISIIGTLLVLAGFSDLSISGSVTTTIGATTALVGAAVMGVESEDFATVYGAVLAVLLVAAGTVPGHLLVSAAGLIGLTAFVPWGVAHFFPGEDRAPLIVLVIGVLIACSGVLLWWLARRGMRGDQTTVTDRRAARS